MTQKYFHLPDYVCAPIQQGDVVGTVELKLAGETIGVVDLIAGQDVSLNPLLFTVARFREFLGQSVPQSCDNAKYYLCRNLLFVDVPERLEPPQAHQKDPPPLSFAPFSRILWKR